MGHVTGSHLVFMALLEMLFLLTDGGNITWLEPPPVETVTDGSRNSITTKQVIQGSLNEELSCNFSLTSDMNAHLVLVKVNETPAVNLYVPNVSLSVEPVFKKTFNAVWVPNKLTLIFFNVTDADKADYLCEVMTVGNSSRLWIRNITLLVLDPSPAMVSSITVPQNLIQTTVSAITASEDPRQTMVASITGSQNSRQIMVSASITGSQSPIPTTDSAITASEVGNLWRIIGLGVGGAVFVIAIAIAIIATVRFLKRGNCSNREEVRPDNQQGNEEVDIVQDGYALLRPLSADGINGNQSERDIQGKEEDTSV